MYSMYINGMYLMELFRGEHRFWIESSSLNKQAYKKMMFL